MLALHGLAVLEANIATIDGRALEVLTVQSSFGPTFSWDKVVADVDLALDGRLAVKARLSDRAEAYRSARTVLDIEPKVEFHLDDSSTATVVEVHAPDSVGVLYRITAAIAELDLDIVRARVQTLPDEVVDSFYVQDSSGRRSTSRCSPRCGGPSSTPSADPGLLGVGVAGPGRPSRPRTRRTRRRTDRRR